MFSKYNNISLPNNYSGNRFSTQATETGMKTHRATDRGASYVSSKTSISPSFQEIIDKTVKESNDGDEESKIELSQVYTDATDRTSQNDFEVGTASDMGSELTNTEPDNKPEVSVLEQLWEAIKSDDLLLIALITLLAGEGASENIDAITILALLLVIR